MDSTAVVLRDATAFDTTRFEQAIAVYREASSSLNNGLTAMTFALVTLIGFSIANQSWGIGLMSAMLELLMITVINAYSRRVRRVLGVARDIEMSVLGASPLVDAFGAGAPEALVRRGEEEVAPDSRVERIYRRFGLKRQAAFIATVWVIHLGVVGYLAVFQDWSFAGSG